MIFSVLLQNLYLNRHYSALLQALNWLTVTGSRIFPSWMTQSDLRVKAVVQLSSPESSSILKFSWPVKVQYCCVFRLANGCYPCRLVVKIICFGVKTSFLVFTYHKPKKRKKIDRKTQNNKKTCMILTSKQRGERLFVGQNTQHNIILKLLRNKNFVNLSKIVLKIWLTLKY